MSTFNLTRSYNLAVAPTVGPGPQVQNPDSVVGTYAAINQGVLDIPSGAATGATFSIPYGGVTSPKGVFVKNASPSGSISVELQGDGLGQGVELPPGGSIDIALPSTPANKPLTQIGVGVVVSEAGLGQVEYIILG